MANSEREQAQRLAARGASIQEIKDKTGLSGYSARVVTSNWAPPAAIGQLTYNSNNPDSRTLTYSPVNGATQSQTNNASSQSLPGINTSSAGDIRQQAIKKADSLGQALKIAASNDGLIGDKEIENLLKREGSNILKIRGLVNDLNTRLAGQNGYIGYKSNAWNQMNKGQYDSQDVARQRLYGSIMDATLGSKATDSLGWARALDQSFQNLDRNANAYEIPGAGTQYGSRNNSGPGGWGIYSPSSNSTSNTPYSTGSIDSNQVPMGGGSYIPPVEPVPEMPGMMSGGGAGIGSATGIRRKRSSWKSQGLSNKGTSALNRGLSINSFNV